MALGNTSIRDDGVKGVKSTDLNFLLGNVSHDHHPVTVRKTVIKTNGVKGVKLLETNSSPGKERQ